MWLELIAIATLILLNGFFALAELDRKSVV